LFKLKKGICLYEFMCGRLPFGEEAEDPYEIYEEIIKSPIIYPTYFKDRKARKLIDQLVNKIPEIRLGGSYASLKANQWFDIIDWVFIYFLFFSFLEVKIKINFFF